jgi:hypothetical protein
MKLKYCFSIFLFITLTFSSAGPAFALETGRNILISVPFTSQAPLGGWKDQRQQDGCEEAVAAMAMAWVGSENNIDSKNWLLRMIILSDFEKKKYGEYRDVSLHDIETWLFRDYFKYKKTEIKKIASAKDLIKELEVGKIILAPMDGRKLNNPNFTGLGPERHMILIRGYDYTKKQFITNDPGTRKGELYRYDEKVILEAIRVYETGYHKPIKDIVKEVIIVSPKK